ncbi:hypothetical protein CARN8_6670002 [mine drainage metagenome]|uniref:Uncharacterized protein n=1 Tax=mine drainage metagenome TaxID=410659 RepID=A0A3P3ZR80_9ZZZZ
MKSYFICANGSPTRARTWDLRINSPKLFYIYFTVSIWKYKISSELRDQIRANEGK